MKRTAITLGLLAAGLLLTRLGAAAPAPTIKCWTNSEGVRECGNVVPPEYAQGRTTTINKRGITTEVQERARSREEIAAEGERDSEAKRLEEEVERQRKAQQSYDRVLLATFTTEQEITDSRDRKLAAISATVEVTRSSINKMNNTLAGHKKRAADLERAGKPMPEELKQDIANLQQQIEQKQGYVAGREQEIEELKLQHERDVARFRELKGIKP